MAHPLPQIVVSSYSAVPRTQAGGTRCSEVFRMAGISGTSKKVPIWRWHEMFTDKIRQVVHVVYHEHIDFLPVPCVRAPRKQCHYRWPPSTDGALQKKGVGYCTGEGVYTILHFTQQAARSLIMQGSTYDIKNVQSTKKLSVHREHTDDARTDPLDIEQKKIGRHGREVFGETDLVVWCAREAGRGRVRLPMYDLAYIAIEGKDDNLEYRAHGVDASHDVLWLVTRYGSLGCQRGRAILNERGRVSIRFPFTKLKLRRTLRSGV